CWRPEIGKLSPRNYLVCLPVCLGLKSGSRVHVQDVQVCYIGKHVPWWFAAPINPSHPIRSSTISL
uniref:Uncharacterized protein n=1 Tax=Macaca fascicularis TaxID=9541 RepID=A0A7N9DAM3_MACFA